MPNNKQAKKRVDQNEKARVRNKAARTSMRSAIKRVLQAESGEAAEAAMPNAMKRIDKAAKVHVIHGNAAARYKGRLARVARAKRPEAAV
jgi:small subunit ribosomal protein S20